MQEIQEMDLYLNKAGAGTSGALLSGIADIIKSSLGFVQTIIMAAYMWTHGSDADKTTVQLGDAKYSAEKEYHEVEDTHHFGDPTGHF